MAWFTAALVASYIGICELRAPTPWQTCDSRWNWALGVLVPSPLPALAKLVTQPRRRSASAKPPEPPAEG
jgi:hypothetical protein